MCNWPRTYDRRIRWWRCKFRIELVSGSHLLARTPLCREGQHRRSHQPDSTIAHTTSLAARIVRHRNLHTQTAPGSIRALTRNVIGRGVDEEFWIIRQHALSETVLGWICEDRVN